MKNSHVATAPAPIAGALRYLAINAQPLEKVKLAVRATAVLDRNLPFPCTIGQDPSFVFRKSAP